MTPTPPEPRPLALSSLPVEPTLSAVLHALLLSNTASPELERDVRRLVEFIERAYETKLTGLPEAIMEGITKLGTFQDTEAYSNGIDYDFEPDDSSLIDQLFVNAMGQIGVLVLTLGPTFHEEWFDYNTRDVYNASVRLKQFQITSVTGLPDLERATALCYAIGIGTDVDLKEAKARFTHCLFWGDVSSLRFLRLLAKEEKDEKALAYYEDLLALWRYLELGLTIVPESEAGRDQKAKEDFALIASIVQDIVIAEKRVAFDFSFLRVMVDPSVSYFDKLRFINEYENREWAAVTEAHLNPNLGFGFSNKGGKKQ